MALFYIIFCSYVPGFLDVGLQVVTVCINLMCPWLFVTNYISVIMNIMNENLAVYINSVAMRLR